MQSKAGTLLHHLFENSVDTYPNHIALVCNNTFISYQELEARANQLTHFLVQNGLKAGDVIGILLERSMHCYVAILAILKLGATYVPIEVEYPDERINYIFSDLPFAAVLTSGSVFERQSIQWPKSILLDQEHSKISQQPTQRLTQTASINEEYLAYIIYTSGSTGKPKGVEITHKSISHYVHVVSDIYEMSPEDKVYQGFSLAFDASLEEIWMAFANAASLIACTSKETRSGVGLVSFLQQHKVTMLAAVPSLVAILEGPWSDLRILVVGGETFPANLVKAWSRPGLKILNTYGPTEATVIATYAEVVPDEEVTIGRALPGYSIHLLNDKLEEVVAGETGEICIGGPAVARGYVNRPESTQEKFIYHSKNPELRLYRTGDLGYYTARGELQFAGRVDDQVKLRGFRIELNEIETIMMKFTGITQAVVSLQTIDQPLLVAYLLIETNHAFDLSAFKAFLKKSLPDYMIPSLIEIVDAFPILTSGKINRKALPKPQQVLVQRDYLAPQTDLERKITQLWEKILQISAISTDADFFYDLGGHSLYAAQIISQLRKIPQLKDISILDLYQNPTITQLAAKFTLGYQDNQPPAEDKERVKYKAPTWKYYLCSVAQFFGIIFQYALNSWQLMAVYCLFFLSSMDNLSLSRELEMLFLYLFLLVPSFSIGVAVIFKWLLLGRVKPGVYPLWGWFYYRWWLVNRLVYNSFFYKYMLGTPLVNIYHRLLGAKIGKNCHIATREIFFFDQFSLGDYSSLGIDSKLNGYIVEDGWLKIGAVEIGEHCYIGSRSVVGINTRIADEVILEEMSMVSDNSSLPSGYYMGSPIRPAAVPTHHVSTREAIGEDSSILENTFFGFMHYLGIIFLMLSTIVSYLPGFAFVDYFYNHTNYVTTIFFAIPVGAVLCLSMHYLFIIAAKKLILNKVQPGFYSLRSFYYLRYWFINDLLDTPDVSILSDSIYLPMLFRLLGAKLGAKVEMGEAPNVIPDLLTIKDGGFVASSVAMGWPQVYGNKIFFAPVTVGKKAFVGNVSFLSGGKTIGDGGLLGCLSLSPTEHQGQQPGSSWLGSPAMFLPNRESFVGYSDATTYNPSKKLYFTRALIEFIRIIIPTAFNLIILYHLFYLIDFMVKTYSWITISLVLPTFELFIVTLLIASLVGLKWVVVGKLKPITKPLWDSFIWKNDLVEFTFSYFINPNFNDFATGSPFIIWVARCFGSKIGKRVFCDTEGFAEFDLIEIGDEVCINRTSLLQTHLYEDRVFKVSTLTIRSGCNVGTSSIILYNTLMEENSSLGNLSLIMKGEYLPTNTQWVGIPAQSLRLSMSYNEQSKETIPDIAEVIKGTVTV